MKECYLGVDIGSISTKGVIIDENNKYYKSDYVLDYGSYIYNSNSASSGYNPEKAKEVLKNAGWVYSNNKWRKNGAILSFTITVNASNTRKM